VRTPFTGSAGISVIGVNCPFFFPRRAFSVMRPAEGVSVLASAARHRRDAVVAEQEGVVR
jgi:hypothetical protein